MLKRLLLIPAFLIFATAIASAEMMSVNAEEANVRKGPGGKHPVIWKTWKYAPVEVIEKQGAWYFIRDFEGYEGWISGYLLSKTPSVTVKSQAANVRSNPSGSADILWEVEKEFSFKVVEVRGSWVQVTDDNGTDGWISKSILWGSI